MHVVQFCRKQVYRISPCQANSQRERGWCMARVVKIDFVRKRQRFTCLSLGVQGLHSTFRVRVRVRVLGSGSRIDGWRNVPPRQYQVRSKWYQRNSHTLSRPSCSHGVISSAATTRATHTKPFNAIHTIPKNAGSFFSDGVASPCKPVLRTSARWVLASTIRECVRRTFLLMAEVKV